VWGMSTALALNWAYSSRGAYACSLACKNKWSANVRAFTMPCWSLKLASVCQSQGRASDTCALIEARLKISSLLPFKKLIVTALLDVIAQFMYYCELLSSVLNYACLILSCTWFQCSPKLTGFWSVYSLVCCS